MQGTRCIVRTWALLLHEAQPEPSREQYVVHDEEFGGDIPHPLVAEASECSNQDARKLQDIKVSFSMADLFRASGHNRRNGYLMFTALAKELSAKMLPSDTDDAMDGDSVVSDGSDDAEGSEASAAAASDSGEEVAAHACSATDSDAESLAGSIGSSDEDGAPDADAAGARAAAKRRHANKRNAQLAAAPSKALALMHKPFIETCVVRENSCWTLCPASSTVLLPHLH